MKTPVRRIVAAHEFSTLNYSLLQKLMFATSHIYGQAYIHNSLHGFVWYNIYTMHMNIAITSANYHIVICLAQFDRPAFLSLTNKAHTLCQNRSTTFWWEKLISETKSTFRFVFMRFNHSMTRGKHSHAIFPVPHPYTLHCCTSR